MRSRRSPSRAAVAFTAAALVLSLAGTQDATAAPLSRTVRPTQAATRGIAGDFDGDGRADLAAGAPGGNTVHVVYSRARVAGSSVASLTPNVTNYRGSMRFGSVLAIGDLNNDGYADLAVGAPEYTTAPNDCCSGDATVTTRGAVFVFLGSATGLHEQPLTLIGNYDGDDPFRFGASLAAADVNGDGYVDLAVADPYAESGNVTVYDGSSTGLGRGHGYTLPGADSIGFGDVNGDGHPDLLVGSTVDYTNPDEFRGSVTVLPGTRNGISAHPRQKIRGGAVDLFGLGSAVATGNVNGDRYADVIVGASTSSPAGGAVVLYGGPHGLSASRHRTITERSIAAHPHRGDAFGASVLIARVRGHRLADVVIGSPDASVNGRRAVGAVYLLRGSRHGVVLSHAQRITPATRGVPGSAHGQDYFGQALYLANVHGRRRLLIGAPGESNGARGGGMVVSLRGTGGGLTVRGARALGNSKAHEGLGSAVV